MTERNVADAIALVLDPSELPAERIAVILAPFGFQDPSRADRDIQRLADQYPSRELFADALPYILDGASLAPDPDAALSHFTAYAEARVDAHTFFSTLRYIPGLLGDIMRILGSSDYLSQVLVRNPHYLSWFVELDARDTSKSREEMEQDLRTWLRAFRSVPARLGILRRFKRRETLRIGMRDLLGISPVEQTTRELAYVADVTFQVAYEIAREQIDAQLGEPRDSDGTPSRYAIIGMGKLGGVELNFSSDVDILAVYSDEGTTTQGTDNAAYFQRLTETVVQSMSEPTHEGYVFRVDLRLRPGGKTGPLARSLDSYEGYYEAWGELFERQALIKARCVAGDPELGEAFVRRIQPFIYRAALDASEIHDTLAEIAHTKGTIERRIAKDGDPALHVKLGPGGIRDVEFVVQALQLLHGGRDPGLRQIGTLDTIDALAECGILTADRASALADSYRYMRRVENFLQLVADRQLYSLSSDASERQKHALRLGYRDEDGHTAGERFTHDYERHRRTIREEFDRVLRSEEDPAFSALSAILDESELPDSAAEFLRSYGLSDPHEAARILNRLAKGSDRVRFSPRIRRAFLRFAQPLLADVAKTADPMLALAQLDRFLAAAGARAQVYPILQEHAGIRELLLSILGTSRFLGDILAQDPLCFEALTYGDSISTRTDSAEAFRARIAEAVSPSSRDVLRDLQRFRYGELLRIGTRDILGESEPRATMRELSRLAEAVLGFYADLILDRMRAEKGEPRHADGAPATCAIIAMGKLGGGEINFSSDLDVLFVFSGDGQTEGGEPNARFFQRLVTTLVSQFKAPSLGSSLYDLDLRLRPHGRGGPMALSLDAYRAYYERQGLLWERQALIKARPVAGDPALGRAFLDAVHAFAYSKPLTTDEIAEIHHTRSRKEDKAAAETSRIHNIKSGYGGLVDIEFLVQTLQLRGGTDDPTLRQQNTCEAIHALSRNGALSAAEASWLLDTYLFLRFVEDRLQIVDNRPLSALPEDEDELEKLARRLDYAPVTGESARERFLNEYHQRTRTTRELFEEAYGRLGVPSR